MRIPTSDSISKVINEMNEVDYTEPGQGVKSEIEFYDSQPVKGFDRDTLNKLMKSNYTEPSKHLQEVYRAQFRAFSRPNKDSFEDLI